jgi:hypothetical protein
VLLVREPILIQNSYVEIVVMPNDAKAYAHDIYKTLREWDKKDVKRIYDTKIYGFCTKVPGSN